MFSGLRTIALAASAAAICFVQAETAAVAQQPASSGPAPAAPVAETAPKLPSSEGTELQSARDSLFVNYLLISCATLGAIIAIIVWRGMPPKRKAAERSNKS